MFFYGPSFTINLVGEFNLLWLEIGYWEGSQTGCTGLSTSDDEWSMDCWYTCLHSDVVSCLSIQDIIIKRTKKGWKVHDWGKVELTTGDC